MSDVFQRYAGRLAVEVAGIEEEAVEAALQGGECGVLVVRGRTQVQAGAHTAVPYGTLWQMSEGSPMPDGEWRGFRLLNWDPLRQWQR